VLVEANVRNLVDAVARPAIIRFGSDLCIYTTQGMLSLSVVVSLTPPIWVTQPRSARSLMLTNVEWMCSVSEIVGPYSTKMQMIHIFKFFLQREDFTILNGCRPQQFAFAHR